MRRRYALNPTFRELLMAVNPEASWVARAVALLRERGIDYAVIGAMARNAYAREPRTTADLDVLIPEAQADAFAAEIAGMMPRGTATRRPDFIVIRKGKKKVIDIGFPANHPLLERAFRDATERRVPALGVARVVPKEAVIVLKLAAATDSKRKPEKAAHDVGDVLDILVAGRVNAAYVRELLALVPPSAAAKYDELRALAARSTAREEE